MQVKNKTQYDVLSPDGFSISRCDTYKTKKEAETALNEWLKRYEMQGYYSANFGRIPLNEVKDYCRIIEI